MSSEYQPQHCFVCDADIVNGEICTMCRSIPYPKGTTTDDR